MKEKIIYLWNKIIDLADEPSTWRGLVWFINGLLAIFEPSKAITFLAIAALISGAIGGLFKDTKYKQLRKIVQAMQEGIPSNKINT